MLAYFQLIDARAGSKKRTRRDMETFSGNMENMVDFHSGDSGCVSINFYLHLKKSL